MSKERFIFVRTKCRALHSLYFFFSTGIGQDITGRLAQEREYTRLIDTANAPIFGVDTQGRVNVWNKCAMRLIGYSTEEVMGRSLVQEFITDDFKTAVQAVLDQALAGDETDNFEFRK